MRTAHVYLLVIPLVGGCGDPAKDNDDDDAWGEDTPGYGGWGADEGDSIGSGPQTSYCEAVCDWVVDCAEASRAQSAADMMDECLAVTRASDTDCDAAEGGELSIDQSLILTECTDDLSEMSCDGLTGSEFEVAAGRPPVVSCIAAYGGVGDVSSLNFSDPATVADIGVVATYNAARNSGLKTGEELCEHVTESLCEALSGCGPGSDTIEEVFLDGCRSGLDAFESQCKANGLYDQTLPLDLNPTRWVADDCVSGLQEADACDVTQWPVECAAAFTNGDGTDLFDLMIDGVQSVIDQ